MQPNPRTRGARYTAGLVQFWSEHCLHLLLFLTHAPPPVTDWLVIFFVCFTASLIYQVSDLKTRDAEVGLGGNNNRARCCPASITPPSGPCRVTSPVEYSGPVPPIKCRGPPWWTRTPSSLSSSSSSSRRTAVRGAWPACSPGCRALRPALCSSGSRTPSGEEAFKYLWLFRWKLNEQHNKIPPVRL